MPAQAPAAQTTDQSIAELASASLAQLSGKKRQFVQAIWAGKTLAGAFRAAYPNAGPSTVNSKPYHLAADPHVQRAIRAGFMAGFASSQQEREAWSARLIQREAQAANANQYTAVARLLEVQGKANGWLSEAGDGQAALAPNEILLSIRANLGTGIADAIGAAIGFGDLGTNAQKSAPVIDGSAAAVAEDCDQED